MTAQHYGPKVLTKVDELHYKATNKQFKLQAMQDIFGVKRILK